MKPIASARYLTVEASKVPWRSVTLDDGEIVQLQLYADGAEGNPEAVRFRFSEGYKTEPHFHLSSQFQLVLSGSIKFPHERLDAPAIHYTDHHVAYGPFIASNGHEMMVLRSKPSGIVLMKDKVARRQANPLGRELSRSAHEVESEFLPGYKDARRKILIPETAGPAAEIVECPPGMEFTAAAVPTYGRYEIIIKGAVTVDGKSLGPNSLRFVQADEHPVPLECGPEGATVIVLTYDQDAEQSYGGSILKDMADLENWLVSGNAY